MWWQIVSIGLIVVFDVPKFENPCSCSTDRLKFVKIKPNSKGRSGSRKILLAYMFESHDRTASIQETRIRWQPDRLIGQLAIANQTSKKREKLMQVH